MFFVPLDDGYGTFALGVDEEIPPITYLLIPSICHSVVLDGVC